MLHSVLKIVALAFICLVGVGLQEMAYAERSLPHVVFATAWESGVDTRIQRETNNQDALKVVAPEKVALSKALRVTIHRSENFENVANGTPRAELSFGGIVRFVRGKEYFISWQTLIPATYVIDRKQPEVISQIHQGQRSGYPTFALFVSPSGRYGVRLRGGDRGESKGLEFGDAANDRGRLVNWTLHYVPDDTGTVARFELRKNDEDVFTVAGFPNAYKGDDSAYFKIGLYKSSWQKTASDVETRELLYGKVSIAQAN